MAKASVASVATVDKKFQMNETTVKYEGRAVYQIQALKSFTIPAPMLNEQVLSEVQINAGDLGGYIEFESNLNQDDMSWICINTFVLRENHRITGNIYQKIDLF